MSARRRLAVVLIIAAITVLGCEEGDIAVAKDFVTQWALDHPVQIAKAKVGLDTGDNLVDAAVGGYEAIEGIKKADELMDEGRDKSDPAKMDEALKLRPNDWTYQLSRADLALRMGDMVTVQKYWYPSLENNPGTVDSLAAYNEQQYNDLAEINIAVGQGKVVFKSYNQCTVLYDQLIQLSSKVVAGVPASRWMDLRAGCEKISH